jgi:hypothetical protein
MPYFSKILDYVSGNSLIISRLVPDTLELLDCTDAWFTLKTSLNNPDNEADLSIHITTATTDGGEIVNAGDGDITLVFVISPAQGLSLRPEITYQYDIKIKDSQDIVNTIEYGQLIPLPGVTQTY